MYKNLLPIGSVVILKGNERYLMICGRIVCTEDNDKIFDYVGCPYPEGIAKSDNMIFFDRDAVDSVVFIGFQDQQEIDYRTEILDQLGELAIVNGEIVPVEE
jgi:hypothetical protein